jgi:hypothetical protein
MMSENTDTDETENRAADEEIEDHDFTESTVEPPEEWPEEVDLPHPQFSENGLEQCVGCGEQISGQGGHHGPVYRINGDRAEAYTEVDAGTPLLCPECESRIRTVVTAGKHRPITEFAAEEGPGDGAGGGA